MGQDGPPIIFLDLDGVLRRETSPTNILDADCVENLATAIGPMPEVQIVISSTWRLALTLSEIKRTLPEVISSRVVGVTPHLLDPATHQRYHEIHAYLSASNSCPCSWMAIDDAAEEFPSCAPLLLVDSRSGFDARCIVALWEHFQLA